MASPFYADRVKETTTTSGTGTVDLAGAESGFQGFVAAGAATLEVEYLLVDGTAWETGLGTITDATPDTLSRTTLIESSTGSAISLSGGTVDVHLTFSAASALVMGRLDFQQQHTAAKNFDGTTITSTSNAVAWAANNNQVTTHTLTENTTFSAPTTVKDGGFYSLAIIQDASASGYTVAFNAVYKFINGTAPVWTTTASAKDYITFRSDGTNLLEQGSAMDVN